MQCWRMLCGVLVLAGAGCGDSAPAVSSDPPVPVAVPEQPAAVESTSATDAVAGGATEATISGFKFQVPAGWRQAELSPAQQGFVDARFEIPRYGDDVKLTLSTISGGVDANIDRWVGQFRLPEGTVPSTETVEVDGIQVTLVELNGEFQGMGQEPQAGWVMLGAAFAGAPRDFYVKLTGPITAVTELKDDFRAFVTSAKRQ